MDRLHFMQLRPGQRISFTGSTQGRDDDVPLHEGIVNGEPTWYEREQFGYVPVHMARLNHNIAVEHGNVQEVLP